MMEKKNPNNNCEVSENNRPVREGNAMGMGAEENWGTPGEGCYTMGNRIGNRPGMGTVKKRNCKHDKWQVTTVPSDD